MGMKKSRVLKRLLPLACVALLGLSWAQGEVPPDVPPGHWAREAVEYLFSKGYLVGYPDGTFRGDAPVTRYQLAMTLYRVVALRPEVVLDEGAMNRIRPLLRELVAEMLQAERVQGESLPKESQPAEVLDRLEERLRSLEERLSSLGDRLPKDETVAEILLQMAILQDRLQMLEEGELPPKLAARVLSLLEEAYAPRLAALEARLKALEARLDQAEAAQRATQDALFRESAARKEALDSLGKRLAQVSEEAKREVGRLEALLPETRVFSLSHYQMGTPTYGPRPPEGFYFLGGTSVYQPKDRTGYQLVAGRAPEGTLFGLGFLQGDEKEAYGVRGLLGPAGGFGFQAQYWNRQGGLDLEANLAIRSYTMPLVVFPDYSGLELVAKGEALGTRFSLKGGALLTAPNGAPDLSLASQVDPCVRTVYGARATLEIPFANFLLYGQGGYGSEAAVQASCGLRSLSYGTYEVGVGHDALSPLAIVPNLDLRLFYGGHTSTLDGNDLGLSYFGVRGSYAVRLSPLEVMLGGHYRAYTPSGDHTVPPSALPLGLAPYGGGSAYGADGLLRLALGPLALQLEASHQREAAAGLGGMATSLVPSLALKGEGFDFRLAYALEWGFNWDFWSPNPLAPTGATNKQSLMAEGRWEAFSLVSQYDLSRRQGYLRVGYRYAW